MPNGYRASLDEQVEKYADAIDPARARSLRTKLMVGELSLAALDLVNALVRGEVPVSSEDATTLRWLLESATLPPDTPPDLADRLVVS